MFRIPSFHQMPNMTFAEAEGILKINGSILTGMEHINEHWDRYANGKSDDMYEDDDDFFSTWYYEVNAYNVVYARMQPLFAGE